MDDRNEVDYQRRLHDESIARRLGKTTADLERERGEEAAKMQHNARIAAQEVLTRPFQQTIDKRAERDPEFAEALKQALADNRLAGLPEPSFVKEQNGEVNERVIGGISEDNGLPAGNANTDVFDQEGEASSVEGSGEGTEQGGLETSPTDGGASEPTPTVDQDEHSVNG